MPTTDITGVISWRDVSHPHAAPASVRSRLPGALEPVIAALETAVGLREDSTKRAAPSAGACYPYEILLAPAGEAVVGAVDLVRRTVVINRGDRARWDRESYTFFLVGRPWLAMRRYGRRGYLYHLLDVGHALLNLSLIAAGSPSDRQPVASVAATGVLLGVGTINADTSTAIRPGWVLHETVDVHQGTPVTDLESMITGLVPPPPDPVGVRVHPERVVKPLVEGLDRRRSASALATQRRPGRLADAIGDIRRLAEQLVPAFGLPTPGITVFSRHQGLGAELPDAGWLTEALVGQQNLAEASTFLVIHAKVPDEGMGALSSDAQRMLIAAGITGEIGYLVAARAGLDMTGVGGFDPQRWAALVGTADDVLFLLAFGRDAAGVKIDIVSTDGNTGR